MSDGEDGGRPEEIWPDEGPGEEVPDDHDYEPHFSRVRREMQELAERLDAVVERSRQAADPSPRRRSILERALEIREEMERLTDESGVRLGVGHMRLRRRVQLLEIRLRELEGGISEPGGPDA